ncbi:GTPase, partial [Holdemania massiliensis]|uniref:GTPase n=1 Tax=Holdemania massiliensis TaxID=1468449 RepID=UPI00242D8282
MGYSNAGKSSLMNALLTFRSISPTKQVDAADQLFATLDSATRRIKLAGRAEILLSDTVGFVRDLPDFLLDAFESTLQEIQEADLLLEVIDAS